MRARAHPGSLAARAGGVVETVGGGVGTRVAPPGDVDGRGVTAPPLVVARVVVRANFLGGAASEEDGGRTGNAAGGVGTVWRTRASSLVSGATGVCCSCSHSASSIASISRTATARSSSGGFGAVIASPR